MASRRKRLFFTLQYTDSTDSNRIKPITSGNLYIMPGGAWVNDTDSLSGTITLNVHDVGELTTAADVVHILDENAAEIATGVISSVKWVTGTGDQVALTITGGSGTAQEGYRIVKDPDVSGNIADIFKYDEGSTKVVASGNALDLSSDISNGVLDVYLEHHTVDLYISGSTQVDSGWIALGVECGAAAAEAQTTESQSMTTAATLEPSVDSGVIVLTDNATTITTIEGCVAGKQLTLINKSGGTITVGTSASEAADKIQNVGAANVSLPDDRCMVLVGHTVGSSAMWAISNALVAATTDLSDVSGTPGSDGDLLVNNSGTWTPGKTLGASDNVLTGYFDDASLYIVKSLTVTGTFDVSALSSSSTLAFPDVTSGTLLVTAATQSDTGAKTFYDTNQSGGGVRVKSGTATDKVMDFDTSAITNSTTRTLSAADADMDLANLGRRRIVTVSGDKIDDVTDAMQGGANGMAIFYTQYAITIKLVAWHFVEGGSPNWTFQLYHDLSSPIDITVPPAGTMTAIMNSAVTVTGSTNGTTTTFADATVPAGSWVWWALSAHSANGVGGDQWMISVEYDIDQ